MKGFDLSILAGLVDHPEMDSAVQSSNSVKELIPKIGIVLITLILSGYFSRKNSPTLPEPTAPAVVEKK